MLSDGEKKVLYLLDELASSSLTLPDQSDLVTKINELLQTLQEESEAASLVNKGSTSSATFVKLSRRRLIQAQKQCLENYNSLRESKTKKLSEHYGTQQPKQANDHELENNKKSNGFMVSEDEDKLSQSIYESKSESITQVLQRMRGIAEGEILRGELNIGELDMSSRTLRELQEKYSAVNVLLNGSRRLVKLLDEAETWDRYCMLASLGFLACVMLYIIYRRIFSGPVKILLWSLFQLVGIARKIPTGSNQDSNSVNTIKMSSGVMNPMSWDSVATSGPVEPINTGGFIYENANIIDPSAIESSLTNTFTAESNTEPGIVYEQNYTTQVYSKADSNHHDEL